MAEEQPELLFLAVNYDANKLLAHELGVKVLPYFLLYRGTIGKIAGFSASLSKIQMLRYVDMMYIVLNVNMPDDELIMTCSARRDAIQQHINPPCEIDYMQRAVGPGDVVSIAVELGLDKSLSMLDDIAL